MSNPATNPAVFTGPRPVLTDEDLATLNDIIKKKTVTVDFDTKSTERNVYEKLTAVNLIVPVDYGSAPRGKIKYAPTPRATAFLASR